MIPGFATLLLFQLAGELLSRLLGLPVPGPVVGLLLLLLALELGLPSGGGLGTVASGLLAHLSLLFVPAGVGIMLHTSRLAAEWPALLVALIVSTVATLAVTGWVADRLSRGRPAAGADAA
jgi:holin-like protein